GGGCRRRERKLIDEREERGCPRRNRPRHVPELHLDLQRPAPRRRKLRRLAPRYGRAQGVEEVRSDRPRGPGEPLHARPSPAAGGGSDQGRLRQGRGGRGGAAAPPPFAAAARPWRTAPCSPFTGRWRRV